MCMQGVARLARVAVCPTVGTWTQLTYREALLGIGRRGIPSFAPAPRPPEPFQCK